MPFSSLLGLLCSFGLDHMISHQEINLKLEQALPIPDGVIHERKILLYSFRNKILELSPLPGLSKEPLERAHDEAVLLLNKLPKDEEIKKIIKENQNFEPLFGILKIDKHFSPSALFTVEQYLFPFFLETKGIKESSLRDPLCHLLVSDLKNVHMDQQTKVLKIKIGKYHLEEEIRLLTQLLEKKPDLKIKLDGNCSLSDEDLRQFFVNFSEENFSKIVYFEEPLADPFQYRGPKIPYAVDENLNSLDELNSQMSLNLQGIVYKPTIWGGFSHALRLKQNNQYFNTPLILSSCYEGPIATKSLNLLASFLDKTYGETIHGIIDLKCRS